MEPYDEPIDLIGARRGAVASVSRRGFVRTGLAALLAPALHGCLSGATGPEGSPGHGNPRLTSRPLAPSLSVDLGVTPLGLGDGTGRDGILLVPGSYDPATPAPLLVALHGATGNAENWTGFYDTYCEPRGMVMLAVDSRDATWDRVRGSFGEDVPFIDLALRHTFDRCAIAADRIALMGFSDGASYSLSLGPSNGDLFTHLVAFSPGFTAPVEPLPGRPPVFVSHGVSDPILSVAETVLVIVPAMRAGGYDVTYEQFDGRHEVPPEIASQALDWFQA